MSSLLIWKVKKLAGSYSHKTDFWYNTRMKFEDNLKKLEGLVGKMESGELNLDDMIKSFEEGRKLVAECQKDLESIRQRIEKVTKDGTIEEMKI